MIAITGLPVKSSCRIAGLLHAGAMAEAAHVVGAEPAETA